jgi:flagellar hook-associated protein FlgK
MSPEKLYEHLKELSDKLGITVQEQSFKQVSLPVKSGFCRVKGKDMFIMDKNISQAKKNSTLVKFLSTQPHENIFIPPAVRELLSRKK